MFCSTIFIFLIIYRWKVLNINDINKLVMMNKAVMGAIMEDSLRENGRLKDEIIKLRKQMRAYEGVMLQQLMKIDKARVIYDTPYECLSHFIEHLRENETNFRSIQDQINLLEKEKIEHKRKIDILQIDLKAALKHSKTIDDEMKHLRQSFKQKQSKSSQEINNLIQKLKIVSDQLAEVKENIVIDQMKSEEDKRTAITTAISHIKQEMVQYREQIERQSLEDTQQLREEVKYKDQQYKALVKMYQTLEKGCNLNLQQVTMIRQLIFKMESNQALADTINNQRKQNLQIKKQLKDSINRRILSQNKNHEFKTEIANWKSQNDRVVIQMNELKNKLKITQEDLEKEKKGVYVLEQYYTEKWNNEFSKVKQIHQKTYKSKIISLEMQFQTKQKQIEQQIKIYERTHQEDTERINQLKIKISKTYEALSESEAREKNLEQQIQQIRQILTNTNLMIVESQISSQNNHSDSVAALQRVIDFKQATISNLNDQILAFHVKKEEQLQDLKMVHQQQMSAIRIQFEAEKSQMRKEQYLAQEKISQRYEKAAQIIKKQEQKLIQESNNQIQSIKTKYQRQLQKKEQAFQNRLERKNEKYIELEKRFNSRSSQFQTLKWELSSKIRELEKQIDQKKSIIKQYTNKNENDESLKNELMMITKSKETQTNQLREQIDDLRDEIQAKESQINHLNHEVKDLTSNKNGWLNSLQEFKSQFLSQLQFLIKNHKKHIQLLKSKIWELENVIQKRPLRNEDLIKMRCLSEQNKVLQDKIELKQAQNIILNQIKYYYEKRHQTNHAHSQMQLTTNFQEHIGSCTKQSLLLYSKKPRRSKVHIMQRGTRRVSNGQQNNDLCSLKRQMNDRGYETTVKIPINQPIFIKESSKSNRYLSK